jgi:steroid delta-isomerase-like uncharacterized protein
VYEQNRALVREFLDRWKKRDFAGMSQLWSPDMVHHARSGDYGPDDVFQLMAGFTAAFPDLEFEIESILADGDLVCTRMTARATHMHDYLGVAATGKTVTCSLMGMVRIANGKIVEHWSVMDELFMLQQLGLVPEDFLSIMAST